MSVARLRSLGMALYLCGFSSVACESSNSDASVTPEAGAGEDEGESESESGDDSGAKDFKLQVSELDSGTEQQLIALAALDDTHIWAAGAGGTFIHSEDGGESWTVGTVEGAEALQFRDIEVFSEDGVVLLAIGEGDDSRIYRTKDGGENWSLQFQGEAGAKTFYDCFDFWDDDHGIAYSDSVAGELVVIETTDGKNWTRIDPERLPEPAGKEAGFAASGSCVVTQGTSRVWMGTAAGDSARVLASDDRGDSWSVMEPPIVGGSESSGITSLVLVDENLAFAFGGDLAVTDEHVDSVAKTSDGGETWSRLGPIEMPGSVYGAAAYEDANILVVAGPAGMDYSVDGGESWRKLSRDEHWTVAFSKQYGWAVGPKGRVSRIEIEAQ